MLKLNYNAVGLSSFTDVYIVCNYIRWLYLLSCLAFTAPLTYTTNLRFP